MRRAPKAVATTYGLTSAETRVLRRILSVSTLVEAAADLAIAPPLHARMRLQRSSRRLPILPEKPILWPERGGVKSSNDRVSVPGTAGACKLREQR